MCLTAAIHIARGAELLAALGDKEAALIIVIGVRDRQAADIDERAALPFQLARRRQTPSLSCSCKCILLGR